MSTYFFQSVLQFWIEVQFWRPFFGDQFLQTISFKDLFQSRGTTNKASTFKLYALLLNLFQRTCLTTSSKQLLWKQRFNFEVRCFILFVSSKLVLCSFYLSLFVSRWSWIFQDNSEIYLFGDLFLQTMSVKAVFQNRSATNKASTLKLYVLLLNLSQRACLKVVLLFWRTFFVLN